MQDFRFPAEWEKQQSTWTAFPFDPNEWHAQLANAQAEIIAFVTTLANHGQNVHLACRNQKMQSLAKAMTHKIDHHIDNIDYPIMEYGDIWLRDTGPITVTNSIERRARIFRFNGWGEKYIMDGDSLIGQSIAKLQQLPSDISNTILEGGAIDVDGAGCAVTTEQCLLNPNRNLGMSKNDIEIILKQSLGIEKLLWLGNGLTADHTDGHVDNLARFIAPGHILIPKADNKAATIKDPNTDIFNDAAERAKKFGLIVSRIQSVGLYEIEDCIAPASYMNFYIANDVVIIPQFNASNDSLAVETIAQHFPKKQCIGLQSLALLSGGGSFHCVSQQLPAM